MAFVRLIVEQLTHASLEYPHWVNAVLLLLHAIVPMAETTQITLPPSMSGFGFGFGRVRVISAAFDSKSAYLGAGLSAPGEAVDISGTVSSLGVLWPSRIEDPQRRIYSVTFVGQHLVRGSTAAAGSSLEWMCRNLLNEDPVTLEQLASKERLAFDAGVDRTVVSKIERAVTNPSIEILLKLANQLDVDLNDLFAN